uniref:Uncharacterized protein n=1 Tax=Panagrolaimus davidi TaxID=227884 RepID=A0A914QWJ8_9BILA
MSDSKKRVAFNVTMDMEIDVIVKKQPRIIKLVPAQQPQPQTRAPAALPAYIQAPQQQPTAPSYTPARLDVFVCMFSKQ